MKKKRAAATSVVPTLRTSRYEELKRALEERRRQIDSSIRGQLASVREERAATEHVGSLDDSEVADVDVQEDIEVALMQMRLETIDRIGAALARLEAGQYGRCIECGDDIAEARLRALPFAVRCVDCEEGREADAHDRQLLTRRLLLFSNVAGRRP
jgi:RNA polymerase-binding transcription factor